MLRPKACNDGAGIAENPANPTDDDCSGHREAARAVKQLRRIEDAMTQYRVEPEAFVSGSEDGKRQEQQDNLEIASGDHVARGGRLSGRSQKETAGLKARKR